MIQCITGSNRCLPRIPSYKPTVTTQPDTSRKSALEQALESLTNMEAVS